LWPAAKALGIDKHDKVNVVLVTSYQRNDGHYTMAQEMEDNFIAPGTAPADDDNKAAVEAFKERVAQQCLFMRGYVLSPPRDESLWVRKQTWLAAHGYTDRLKDSQKPVLAKDFKAYLSAIE
jgi:hypothetical protein